MSVVVETLAELERELAKRGASMMARIDPGKDRHRVLIMVRAIVTGPQEREHPVEASFVGETVQGATAGALARFDFQVTKINSAGNGPH